MLNTVLNVENRDGRRAWLLLAQRWTRPSLGLKRKYEDTVASIKFGTANPESQLQIMFEHFDLLDDMQEDGEPRSDQAKLEDIISACDNKEIYGTHLAIFTATNQLANFTPEDFRQRIIQIYLDHKPQRGERSLNLQTEQVRNKLSNLRTVKRNQRSPKHTHWEFKNGQFYVSGRDSRSNVPGRNKGASGTKGGHQKGGFGRGSYMNTRAGSGRHRTFSGGRGQVTSRGTWNFYPQRNHSQNRQNYNSGNSIGNGK